MDKSKKQLIIFFFIAYVVMAMLYIPSFFTHKIDIDNVSTANMMLPACGVIIARILTEDRKSLPIYVYFAYIVSTLTHLILTINSYVAQNSTVSSIMSLVSLFSSMGFLAAILNTTKEKRVKNILNFGNGRKIIFVCVVFILLYYIRMLIATILIGGTVTDFIKVQDNPLKLLDMIYSIILSIIVFFGEEYGWRAYLGPMLQKKYGNIRGIVFLGILWGVWHIFNDNLIGVVDTTPLIVLQMVFVKIITCIVMSFFMVWGVQKTGTIWTATIIHFLNNNLQFFIKAGIDNSTDSAVEVIGLNVIMIFIVMAIILAIPFFIDKTWKKPQIPTFEERLLM